MEQDKSKTAIMVAEKMIADMEKKILAAVQRDDWDTASQLSHYVKGEKQILILFEQAVQP